MYTAMQQTRSALGPGRMRARALFRWTNLLFLVIGAAAAPGPSTAWSAVPEIVARVNGEPVTRGEWQRTLTDPLVRRQLQRELGVQDPDRKQLARLALQKLIIRRLVLQEAARRNVTVTQRDLSEATTALRSRFKELKDLGAWMKARGLDDGSLQDLLRDDLLVTRVLAALVEGVRLSDGQVEEYYAAHQEDLKVAEEIQIRIIAVQDKMAADEILAAVRKGGDFDRLAREQSKGYNATGGGDMGWVNPQSLLPPLQEAVATLKVGETAGPVQTNDGLLIIRLEERQPARTLSLAEVRPQIERRLLVAKQQEVVQTWLKEQEKQSKIEVLIQAGSFTTGAVIHRPND